MPQKREVDAIELADDDSPEFPAAQLWVKMEDVQLTQDDKAILLKGRQLNDRHMNAVQRLLKTHHPTLKGLCSTLLAASQKLPPRGLHAFFVRGNHWIVLSTLGCRPGEVNVYDSLYTSQDPGTLSAISGSLEVFRPAIIVNIMDIEKQKGGDDCGLFAVAVLTALANGIDSNEIMFDQEEMRCHAFTPLPRVSGNASISHMHLTKGHSS